MEIARRLARTRWREFGARSEREALSFTTTMVRRTVGVGILIAHARHRLRRVPLAGVDRPTFVRSPAAGRGGSRPAGRGGMGAEIGGLRLEDFYAYQAAFPHGAAAVAGGG